MTRFYLLLSALVFTLTVASQAHATTQTAALAMPKLFGGDFELVDHNKNTVTQESFKGKFMLINFGYTFCPDICPTGLSTMASALDELKDQARDIQPIFVTVDPQRDTPDILKSYVGAFHPKLIGLSGSNQQIKQVTKAYRVHRSKVLEANKPKDEYLVNHSSLTYLMDRDGKFLTIFPHGTHPEKMAETLRKYVR